MANPKVKDGYFPVANELAEIFALVNIKGEEWRIIWVLWRKTWGWKDKINPKRRKDWDWISISQFEKATGMKRTNVHRTLQQLLAHRLILKDDKFRYKFNQNHDEWVLAHRLTPVSPQANGSVSSQANNKIKHKVLQKKGGVKKTIKKLDNNNLKIQKQKKKLIEDLSIPW